MLKLDRTTGEAIQKSCLGPEEWIKIRDTVANVPVTETTLDQVIGRGRIDISKYNQMSLILNYSAGSPGLTNTDIRIYFTDNTSGISGILSVLSGSLSGTDAILTVYKTAFRMVSSGLYLFNIPLPPAKYAALTIQGTGDNTLSQLNVRVGLGWGSGFQLVSK